MRPTDEKKNRTTTGNWVRSPSEKALCPRTVHQIYGNASNLASWWFWSSSAETNVVEGRNWKATVVGWDPGLVKERWCYGSSAGWSREECSAPACCRSLLEKSGFRRNCSGIGGPLHSGRWWIIAASFVEMGRPVGAYHGDQAKVSDRLSIIEGKFHC